MHYLAERVAKTNALLAREVDDAISDLHRQVNSRDTMLVQKDAAMGVLFDRLAKAGVDCSDLIP